MPAVSVKQRRFFAICEHDPQHARGKCPNMSQEKFHEYTATPEKDLPLKKRMIKSYG